MLAVIFGKRGIQYSAISEEEGRFSFYSKFFSLSYEQWYRLTLVEIDCYFFKGSMVLQGIECRAVLPRSLSFFAGTTGLISLMVSLHAAPGDDLSLLFQLLSMLFEKGTWTSLQYHQHCLAIAKSLGIVTENMHTLFLYLHGSLEGKTIKKKLHDLEKYIIAYEQ